MFKRKSVVYAFVVTTLLLSAAFGTYTVNAQTGTTPAATPVTQAEPAAQMPQMSAPSTMAEGMTAMLDQMQAMMAAAPDDAARQQMAPAMMATLNGMMGLNQTLMDQMQSMPGPEQQAMAGPMMENMTRMTEMMGQMQPMMGTTSPMSGTQSMGAMGGGMQMGQMMGMMGQMMQMMGQMDGGMMGGGMMEHSGSGMMGGTAPMTGTMPMSGTQSMQPMGDGMQMGQMMGMMGQMMQMMGHMQMMDGHRMMGEGMGEPGAMTVRQAEVAERGAQVMPFGLEQTTHIFKKLESGGVQQVIVKEGADAEQIRLIQTHLSQEAEKFGIGDFGDPAQIHGDAMPGLAVLRERASEIDVQYTDLDNGGQIEFTSVNPELIAALHAWFDAQLSDHGMHATTAMPSAMPAQSSMSQAPKGIEPAPQSIEGGGVTVKVTPLSLTDEAAISLDFEVVLDTHSVELNFDLAQMAVLRDNLGNEYQPAAWTPEQSGGHHVSGKLSFANRSTILQTGVTSLELDVTGVAGVPSRLFQWSVGK